MEKTYYFLIEKNGEKTILDCQTLVAETPPFAIICIADNFEECYFFEQKPTAAKLEIPNKDELFTLGYNNYKGSGKCWIAIVDERTRKIETFLVAESTEKDGTYKGIKRFLVPLIENTVYKFCESGSKSSDSIWYSKVVNGKLEKIQ